MEVNPSALAPMKGPMASFEFTEEKAPATVRAAPVSSIAISFRRHGYLRLGRPSNETAQGKRPRLTRDCAGGDSPKGAG
jgi:hypothetical protein